MKTIKRNFINTSLKSMELIIGGDLGHERSPFDENIWISSGEYRYFADEAFFGAAKVTGPSAAFDLNHLLNNTLYESLTNFPYSALETTNFSFAEWKLKVFCADKQFVEALRSRIELNDGEDGIVEELEKFANVSLELITSKQAREYLDADEPVREEY